MYKNAKLKIVVYYSNIKYFACSLMYSNIRWSWRFAVQREGKWKFGENFLALTKYTFGKGVERNKITWKRRGWDEILSLCIYRCVSDSLRLLRRMLQTPFLSKTHSEHIAAFGCIKRAYNGKFITKSKLHNQWNAGVFYIEINI